MNGRPFTSVPEVVVRIDGAELDAELGATLTSVRVRREASAPTACALSFEPVGAAAQLEAVLAPGASVTVALAGDPDPLFVGDVVVLERRFPPDTSPELVARCHDRAHRLRSVSRLRVFVDVTVAELARELAEAADLVVDADASGPRVARLIQDGRSSLDLLTALTRRAGLWWQVDRHGSQLRVFGPEGTGTESSVELHRELIEASVTSSQIVASGGWRVAGWDPGSGEVTSGNAERDTSSGEPMIAEQGMLAGAERADALARGLAADDDAEARVLHACVQGDPALTPGHRLAVEGLTPEADGSYLILTADHRLDPVSGYTCTVSSAPPEHLQLRRSESRPGTEGAAVTVGEVVRIDDPSGLGRVRVSLSAYDDLESEWMPVLALGAGEAKGLAVQPDVGDRVVVAHDLSDPGSGVVLGSLRTSDGGEAGVGVVDGAVGAYGLRLPTGQLLRISGEADSVVLANAAGTRLELSDAGVVVHSEGDLVLEAPGRTLRLRARSIEMEQA